MTNVNTLSIIKWLATLNIIIATAARAFEFHNVDLTFGTLGTALWLIAAYKMREPALVIVNVICLAFLMFGLVGAIK